MQIRTKHSRDGVRTRGTVLLIAILLTFCLTGMVLAIAWGQGLMSQGVSNGVQTDEAFFIAESGAQRALWMWKHNSYTWNSTGTWAITNYASATGRASETWYQAYSCTPSSTVTGGYNISCSSKSGVTAASSAFQCAFVATPPSGSATLLAGGINGNISGTITVNGDYATNGALNSGGSVTVTGNVTLGGALNSTPHVGGNLSVNGDCNGAASVGGNMIVTGNCNSSPTVGGNLAVNGSIYGSPAVTGTKTAGAHNTVTVGATPDVNSYANTLISQATAAGTMNNPSSVTALNFSATTNNIIYINGSANIASNCVVTGSGTVVVTGSWNQSVVFPKSGTNANINIVCKSDLNISGAINITGSMYTAGNWNQSGTFNVTGVVATVGNANVSGTGTLTSGPAPSFDTRGGGSSITQKSFSGPVL